ncbi:MAG: Spore_coat_protein_CotF [uncultured Chloroflexia bacterium]|uniref:Spore_coat_protein_CotF n=1 Tax=uncultured Chloroflexia bacterium TaxID=1672391 RepID=A0A6J4MLW5_9CHLR|nr:MAG: Spore_coat_protein_CotF [uncultured Chloroflexia bacterium]
MLRSKLLVALDDEPVLRETLPVAPKVTRSHDELRIELPFRLALESLGYIGVVSHETWHVAPHEHDHFELCYVAEGRGWFAIDTQVYHVRDSTLFLTKSGEVHHGAALGTQPFRLYYLGFHLRTMRSLEAAFYQLGTARTTSDQGDTIRAICEAIFEELEDSQPFRAEMVQGLFLQLLVATSRVYATSAVQHPQTVLSPAIKRVLDQLHAHITARPDVAALGQRAHLSRSQLDREFKRHLGVTLGRYARSLCIERAKYLLRNEAMSVSTVADTLDFSSIHTFSIFFKRHVGVSPREYGYACRENAEKV